MGSSEVGAGPLSAWGSLPASFSVVCMEETATPSKDLKNVLGVGEWGVSTGMEGNCQVSKNAFVIKKTSEKFSRRSEGG